MQQLLEKDDVRSTSTAKRLVHVQPPTTKSAPQINAAGPVMPVKFGYEFDY